MSECSHPKILFLVNSLTFCSTIKFNPYLLPFEFLIIYHSSETVILMKIYPLCHVFFHPSQFFFSLSTQKEAESAYVDTEDRSVTFIILPHSMHTILLVFLT